MVLTNGKRVVTSVFTVALLISSHPTNTDSRDIAGKVATAGVIAAGVLGLGAALYYAFSEKSDEQLICEAQDAVPAARVERRHYYDIYEYFIGLRTVVEIDINDIEQQFLYPVALRAWTMRTSVDAHVNALNHHFSTLKSLLDALSERVNRLEGKGQTHTALYDRLVWVRRDVRDELSHLDGYYHMLAQHRAFFSVYAYEAMLYDVYERERGIIQNYQYDPFLLERYILQAVHMHGISGEYPLIIYWARLNDHIDALINRINNLKYYYPGRTPLANQLLEELNYVRSVVEMSLAFREEKRVKREREDQEARLAIQRREAFAYECEVNTRAIEAAAEWALVREEREHNRIEREKLRQQQNPQVIIITDC